MKAWLWIVSLLPCIAADPTPPVMCEMCMSQDTTSCKGPVVPCASKVTKCVVGVVETTRDGKTSRLFMKSCADTYMSDQNYTATVDTMHYELRSICCDPKKNCKVNPPAIQPRNMTANGLTCDTCFAFGLSGCDPTKKMKCTGLEKKCVTYSGLAYGEMNRPTISYRGCGTESSCPKKSTPNAGCEGPKMSCSEPTRSY